MSLQAQVQVAEYHPPERWSPPCGSVRPRPLTTQSISSPVVFTGEAKFKSDLPVGGYSTGSFIKHIQSPGHASAVGEQQAVLHRKIGGKNRLALTQQADLHDITQQQVVESLQFWGGVKNILT
jgi:hypothetical protein